MTIEAVVLTGGESRRMGQDKATTLVEGIPQAERIVASLRKAGYPVTVLGRSPIEGAKFVADSETFAGPLNALAQFQPQSEAVFVVSCDVPLFEATVVAKLGARLSQIDAVVPLLDGWRQPLGALYRATAFGEIPATLATGRKSLMAWLDRLRVVEVDEAELNKMGVDPFTLRSANTPEELSALLARRITSGP